MSEIRILSAKDVAACLTMGEVIDAVRATYEQKATGEAEAWPMVYHAFEPGVADIDIKSGVLGGAGVFGHKTVAWFSKNPARGLPDLYGLIVVLSTETGEPVGVVDGAGITGLRTGAAGALGARVLANPGSESLLMVGAGHQALYQVAATLSLSDSIKTVRVANPHNPDRARDLAQRLPQKLADQFRIERPDVRFEAAGDLAQAVDASDIVITATMSTTPLIDADWVRFGTHFSCMGADMPGKQEIDPAIIAGGRLFTDDTANCIGNGEIELGLAQGVFDADHVAGELGEVLAGKVAGRTDPDEVTVFDSAGTALLDIACAKMALDAAAEHGLGTVAAL
ncbi:ornithine cyclodeaminase family protein [Adlercreutzia sp. R25]|uniref:Ornithine cyclodeaminase family protein n=1 Tax=Adlercreutzia shanghongiae TaxID=3111773 RepID=A0ABU6J0W3_9ACTN|nr:MULTISPECIES: ornithine cyclodeaminase family protein [unclassified Adlercreutzia]MEC4273463.1 ornithine cyclodeaminase family protein [Adlercreutzia sp. R25]MEC4295725.1 ornithine cyclodeaminase family protein [Adlercreutzia sp. R22]